jgi:hypothetical protein
MPRPTKTCPRCGEDMSVSRTCGVYVCENDDCQYHAGLVRCFCGWADDGGDGREQLEQMGETIDPE